MQLPTSMTAVAWSALGGCVLIIAGGVRWFVTRTEKTTDRMVEKFDEVVVKVGEMNETLIRSNGNTTSTLAGFGVRLDGVENGVTELRNDINEKLERRKNAR